MISVNSNQWKTIFSVHSKTENNKKKDPSVIERLPTELKERLASFLSTRDLLNLAETSKSLSNDLNLSIVSSPLTDRASQDKNYRSRRPQCFAVVIPKNDSSRIHSMTFTCNVANYGFANSANVSIVEQDLPLSQHPSSLRRIYHHNGKEKSSSTTRTGSKFCLSFLVKNDKFYQFYVSTSCMNDEVYVRFSDMSLHCVGFSKPSAEFASYQFDVLEVPVVWNFEHMGLCK